MMKQTKRFQQLSLLYAILAQARAFQVSSTRAGHPNAITSSKLKSPRSHACPNSSAGPTSTSLYMNFFKDLIDGAFENDRNLPNDTSQNQLEGPNDVDLFSSASEKTDVQKRWLESQAKQQTQQQSSTTNDTTGSAGSSRFGAPMNPAMLPNTQWKISLYLTGIPNFDPSNSLYGSKVNISTRRDSSLAREGFAVGADTLPDTPNAEFTLTLLDGGKCQIEASPFTSDETMGEWKLSDDGRMIRFSMMCLGYERTVTTMGTIQNVYWSDREDVERKTSATYSIDPGLVFAEARVGYGAKPGVFTMAMSEGAGKDGPGGLLKVEKSSGVFGVTTKTIPCGKFSASMILEE